MTRLSLAAILLASHVACAQPEATPLPRDAGPPEPSEAQWVTGLDYAPSDAPRLWRHPDTLLVAHVESYARFDLGGTICAGGGFFAVPVTSGIPHALDVGRPACDATEGSIDPTGRWVVFSAHTEPNNSALVRLDLTNGRLDTLRTGCRVYAEEPAWSPDGRALAFHGLCESRDQDAWVLYLVGSTGRGLRAVPGEPAYSAKSPSWSPDGRHLAYVRTRATDFASEREIAVVEPRRGGRRVLARGHAPAWSPDGMWIAYIADRPGELRDAELRLVRSDGTRDTLLFRSPERTTYARGWGRIREGLPSGPLVWSPNGEWLAYRRSYDRGTTVWRVNVRTGEAREVTRRGD